MTIAQVNREVGNGGRAGTQTLALLSAPINVQVLQALAEEPRSLTDLRRHAGSPPATTMRGRLRTLVETGVLVRRRQSDFPGALDYELTSIGRELLAVVDALRSWLADSPHGPVELGSAAAKGAIKAFVEGWGTSMLRGLAARPLTLTELDRLIAGVSYPSLERRLAAMRLAGQIEPCPSRERGTPYAVTPWLRRAMAPLATAFRWERANVAGHTRPIGQIDAEAAFLLAFPLVRLEPEISGRCRLAIELRAGGEDRVGGVLVEVEEGRVVSCSTRNREAADAWASGSAASWLSAVIEHDPGKLEMGGDCGLAGALVDGLHGTLFVTRPLV